MMLLDREKDSAVNNTLNGRYKGLRDGDTREVKNHYYVHLLSAFVHICRSGVCVPVVHGTGGQVCV
jgi:hypothetical protein